MSLLREHQIDTIVHFAAETHVDRSITSPEPFIQTNMMGTLYAAGGRPPGLAARERQARGRCASITSRPTRSLARSHPATPPGPRTRPTRRNSPYSASKASSDHLVRAYGHTYGLPVTISNCSNNYGPYQFPEKLIPLMILNAQAGKPLPVYGDGQQMRDWLYVEDHCEAIHAILEARPARRDL